jgi:hypothetical protein
MAIDGTSEIASIFTRYQALYDEIAKSHPSLINGLVRCSRCGASRTVDAARCLRDGWPKCCGGAMGLQPAGSDQT